MISKRIIASALGIAVVLSFGVANAASALTVSCAGVPTSSNIAWTASSTGGISPIAFLWGNGSTSSTQTIAVSPGTYAMTLSGTDASTTVATTTCSATVLAVPPSITSFVATPSSITSGQSSVLSWVVTNASSTSLDNGIGAISSTSITVTPSVTTTYHLSAVSPNGTATGSATVTVNASTTTGNGSLYTQIQNLLNQIAALKAQIAGLILQAQQGGNGTGTSTPPTTGTSTTCFNFGRDLRGGDKGDDVKELQRILASDPSILPPGLITGFFGHRTQEALIKYQRKFGIATGSSTIGFFGPMSRKHFNEHCGAKGDDRDEDNDDHQGGNASSTASSTNKEHGKSGEQHGRGHDKNGHGHDD